uniref:Uncharacterized protein n=1 Tax=Ixodes ricinus TaxID=34613 RepID=A0A6B0UME0_IXORI
MSSSLAIAMVLPSGDSARQLGVVHGNSPVVSKYGSWPFWYSMLQSQSFHVPSLDTDAILLESLEKAKENTPDVWPLSSKARLTSLNSPVLEKHTSHTFTSGVKPDDATKRPQGDTQP